MTTNDQTVILVEHAIEEAQRLQSILGHCLHVLTTAAPSRRSRNGRQMASTMAQVMKMTVSSCVSAQSLEAAIRASRADTEAESGIDSEN
jgi:hypothetical protein